MIKTELPVIILKGIVLLPNNDIKLEFDNDLSKSIIDVAELFHDNKILIVSNENKILTTIKSRCMKIFFDKISDEQVKKFLLENCNISNLNNNILKMCDNPDATKVIRFLREREVVHFQRFGVCLNKIQEDIKAKKIINFFIYFFSL